MFVPIFHIYKYKSNQTTWPRSQFLKQYPWQPAIIAGMTVSTKNMHLFYKNFRYHALSGTAWWLPMFESQWLDAQIPKHENVHSTDNTIHKRGKIRPEAARKCCQVQRIHWHRHDKNNITYAIPLLQYPLELLSTWSLYRISRQFDYNPKYTPQIKIGTPPSLWACIWHIIMLPTTFVRLNHKRKDIDTAKVPRWRAHVILSHRMSLLSKYSC